MEIIRELTKCKENNTIHSENMPTWAKRVEVPGTQMAVISSLHEAKIFDTIIQKYIKQRDKRPTTNTLNTRRRCKYCGQEHKLRQCPVYGKMCDKCCKLNHFKEVCRDARNSAFNTIEKETVHEQMFLPQNSKYQFS